MKKVAKVESQQTGLTIEVSADASELYGLEEFMPSFAGGSMTEKQENALSLHEQIKQEISNIAFHLVLMSKNLKRMRDEELYREFGFEEFGEYTETALRIKQRQAYNYIQAYEQLGETFLQSNASYGISKLQLLSTLSTSQRDELIEKNDVENITVAELKKLLAERDRQISFFESKAKTEKKADATMDEEAKALIEDKKRLEEAKAAFEDKKRESIQQAVNEAIKAEKAELEKKIKNSEKIAREKAIKEKTLELEKKIKTEKTSLEAELKKQQEELAEKDRLLKQTSAKLSQEQQERSSLEKRAATSANPDYEHFKFEFEKMQEFAVNVKKYYYKLSNELREKLKKPIQTFISSFFDEDAEMTQNMSANEKLESVSIEPTETASAEPEALNGKAKKNKEAA